MYIGQAEITLNQPFSHPHGTGWIAQYDANIGSALDDDCKDRTITLHSYTFLKLKMDFL